MAETSYPFDTQTVAEAEWETFARLMQYTGVVANELNELAVSANSPAALNVLVATGRAFIEGYGYQSSAQETVTISAADATNDRIDRVVVRLDRTNNEIVLAVLTGTPAGTPAAPSLTQNATLHELSLAQIAVAAAATVINTADITDERYGAATCGMIARTPLFICASSDRPSTWPLGGMIFEQDTEALYQNVGTSASPSWQRLARSGVLGDGSDGAVTFDGVATILSIAPAGSAYTLTRDIFCTSITVDNGVTINTAGYRIFCTGTLTNNGTIRNNGSVGGATGGAGGPGGYFLAGAAGGSYTGPQGTAGSATTVSYGGAGGDAGAGTSGTGGAATDPAGDVRRLIEFVALGAGSDGTNIKPWAGGGGGGGDGCTCVPTADGGLTIKACNANNSLDCGGTKKLDLIVCGGRGPYTWSKTGSIVLSRTTGNRTSVTPPTNSGSAVSGKAYSKAVFGVGCGHSVGSTHAAGSTKASYNCDDSLNTCPDGVVGNTATVLIFADSSCQCATHNGHAISGAGSIVEVACDNIYATGAECTAAQAIGSVVDHRTAGMISDGCNPCGVQAGATVSVTDAVGTVYTIILRA